MLPAARRVLEVVVPLVYRPAMKAAFLDLGTAGITAKVLRLQLRALHTLAAELCGWYPCCSKHRSKCQDRGPTGLRTLQEPVVPCELLVSVL